MTDLYLAPHVVVGICIIVTALMFWLALRLMDPK